jgi:hypothetical protein
MNQEHILSNESKMAVRSKMADQNQIFWRNSERIQKKSISFLHSLGLWMDFGGWSPARLLHAGLNSGLMCNKLGLSETQILWKKVFQKIQDSGWNEIISLSRHLGFLKNFFSTKFASHLDLMNAKRKLNFFWILSELRQKI